MNKMRLISKLTKFINITFLVYMYTHRYTYMHVYVKLQAFAKAIQAFVFMPTGTIRSRQENTFTRVNINSNVQKLQLIIINNERFWYFHDFGKSLLSVKYKRRNVPTVSHVCLSRKKGHYLKERILDMKCVSYFCTKFSK